MQIELLSHVVTDLPTNADLERNLSYQSELNLIGSISLQ